jgi:plastocyanin
MRRLILFLSLFLAAPAAAQERAQDWRMAAEYDVLLTSYAIQPKVLHLKAGEPVRLRFVNNSNQPHRFAAAAFFARAEVPEHLRGLVKHGAVFVAPLSEETLVLVPKAGHYGVSGGPLAQRLLGMHGRIVVE